MCLCLGRVPLCGLFFSSAAFFPVPPPEQLPECNCSEDFWPHHREDGLTGSGFELLLFTDLVCNTEAIMNGVPGAKDLCCSIGGAYILMPCGVSYIYWYMYGQFQRYHFLKAVCDKPTAAPCRPSCHNAMFEWPGNDYLDWVEHRTDCVTQEFRDAHPEHGDCAICPPWDGQPTCDDKVSPRHPVLSCGKQGRASVCGCRGCTCGCVWMAVGGSWQELSTGCLFSWRWSTFGTGMVLSRPCFGSALACFSLVWFRLSCAASVAVGCPGLHLMSQG